MPHSCSDYRREMILASLKRQAADPHMHEVEKEKLREQIRRLETELGLE